MDEPLVSVITPTWHRADLLLNRCIPSVQAQTYPAIEHLIVSDGPDAWLTEKLSPFNWVKNSSQRSQYYFELPERDPAPHWGHFGRLHGLEYAAGTLITYCDDDDALRPEHVALLAAALAEHPEAGFACSRMLSHGANEGITEIGHGPPSCGNIGTPMIMHRAEILKHGTWGPAGDFEDWDLVNRWLHAGIGYTQVDAVTVDVWPSLFFGPGR